MGPARISPEQLGTVLPSEGLCWISGCSAESDAFRAGLSRLERPGLTFVSVFVPGLNRAAYLLQTGARVTTFFMLPELAGSDRVTFLPLPYRNIRRWLSRTPPEVVMVMVAPPDADGICSFGAVTDFVADLWQSARVVIGHINPNMPRTRGTPGIPFDRFDAVIEQPQALRESDPGLDEAAQQIAAHAAEVIPDGASIQAGIGRVPEAILRGLTGKRDLAIRSGLIGDSTLHLLQAGALRAETPVITGIAIGSAALYQAVSGPGFTFRPPSVTHDLATLARYPGLITINSGIEVDLDGQVYAEATPKGLFSGPGGAADFVAGARAGEGLRIIALPSTAARGRVSRIVAPGTATGPASLGRFDTDLVITEHGIADLRLAGPSERHAALTRIAAPEHRPALRRYAHP